SRANPISLLRSSSLRKPPARIMRATESAKLENARNFSRLFNESKYTITFSDSCRRIASHFAFAYRVAYLVQNQDTGRSPGVTHESSVSCRQQTPWYDGCM